MLSEPLLHDFLTTHLSLTELAARHHLTLHQLISWADSPEVTQLFENLERIAAKRSAMIACDSSATALTNLAQLSHSLVQRAELANAAATSAPDAPRIKPPSITAIESTRKACTTLLRLCSKPRPRPEPDDPSPASALPDSSPAPCPRNDGPSPAGPNLPTTRATDRQAGPLPAVPPTAGSPRLEAMLDSLLPTQPIPPPPSTSVSRLAALAGGILTG